MAPLPDQQQVRGEVAFTLSFEHPGKARRRTPENWSDFEACTIRLRDDVWTSEPTAPPPGAGGKLEKMRPARLPFYDALIGAIGKSAVGRGETTLGAWELECLRRRLIERVAPGTDASETSQQRAARHRDFRKAKSDLLAARWIIIEDDRVIDLKGRWS